MRGDNNLTKFLPVFTLSLYAAAATIGAFAGGLWAALGIGGAIVLFFGAWRIERRMPEPRADFAILAGVALVVMAALNLQSSQPGLSWHEWLKLATIFAPLLLLSSPPIAAHAGHPKFIPVMLTAAALGALALGLELYCGGPLLHMARGPGAPLTQYNRGLSYLAVLAFPLMAGLRCGRFHAHVKASWAMIAFIAILLIPASLTESRAAKLALVLGLAATVIAHYWPVWTRRMLAAVPFVLLGWPFAVRGFYHVHYGWLRHFPDSWRDRMEIWDYMAARIAERPWLGWGLGSSHALPFSNPDSAGYAFVTGPAAHPHNVVIQLWVELGLPGLALGLAFALLTLRKASGLDARLAPFAIGAWVAALCLSLVAYDFWTDSLFAAFALAGFAFALPGKNVKS